MTSAEKKAIYAALAKPFDEHCIQRTEGRLTGRGYDTTGIGYQHIANRLNEVLGVGGWRAHRTVTVKEIVRAATAGPPSRRSATSRWNSASGSMASSSSSRRAWPTAATWPAPRQMPGRAATRTHSRRQRRSSASGRQAYEGSLDDDNLPGEHVVQAVQSQAAPAACSRRCSGCCSPCPGRAAAAGYPGAHQEQADQQAARRPPGHPRKLGMDHGGLRAISKQRFNAQPEFLTRDQASQMIAACRRS